MFENIQFSILADSFRAYSATCVVILGFLFLILFLDLFKLTLAYSGLRPAYSSLFWFTSGLF